MWKGMVGVTGEEEDASGDGGNDEGDLSVDGGIDGNRSGEDSGKEVGEDGEDRSGGAQESERVLSTEDLLRAAKCGKWGPTRPSDLFLKVWFLLPSLTDAVEGLVADKTDRFTMMRSAHWTRIHFSGWLALR
jgi:hypothetical protein